MTVANGKLFRKVFFFNSYFVQKLPLNLFVSKVKFFLQNILQTVMELWESQGV